MSDYAGEVRRRGRTLLIVEGNHEKNKLFWLVFKCFPEINIDMEDVWIYGTNIYLLYDDIVKEYGDEWADEADDIDLPFVISKKQHPDSLCYKDDFTNIILVFDYERHDPNFSEGKILKMQRCFDDAADMGKLYINYPMIESYQHLKALPDFDYAERKILVSLRPGKEYKALVDRETVIDKAVEFPHRMNDLLEKHFGILDEEARNVCCSAVLNLSNEHTMEDMLQEIFHGMLEGNRCKTLKYQLVNWIEKLGYAHAGQTYWEYIRDIFKEIIYHNICKANRIQCGQYEIEASKYRECFEGLDLSAILQIQNDSSKDVNAGFIWVLNTCVFFVAEYNFALMVQERRQSPGAGGKRGESR